MHKAYIKDVEEALQQFKGLLPILESGAISSSNPEADIARVKRNIALNEAVLRIDKDRSINAKRS